MQFLEHYFNAQKKVTDTVKESRFQRHRRVTRYVGKRFVVSNSELSGFSQSKVNPNLQVS